MRHTDSSAGTLPISLDRDSLANGHIASRLLDEFDVFQHRAEVPIISIGMGTCGMAAGGQEIWQALQERIDQGKLRAKLRKVGCIGFCQMEVMVDIQKPGKPRVSFANVKPATIDSLIETFLVRDELPQDLVLGISEGYPDRTPAFIPDSWAQVPLFRDLPYFRKQKRVVLGNTGVIDPDSLEEYLGRDGYRGLARALAMSPQEVVSEVLASGLRGRGGGGFPTGRKWDFAQKQPGDRKFIVMNADEGDPGAFMDRSVLEGDPHRIIEGMTIGGYAIGASTGYIYCRAEYPLAIENLQRAIGQAKASGLLGNDILGSGFSFDLIIKKGAGAFVCGEETALIASIEGKRGMPKPRPPYPAVSGVFGCPTVINNVETFANVPVIIFRGPEAFAAIGTAGSKGTKVFALTGKIANSGLIEVPMGITLREIIYDVGGGILDNRAFKAAQIGGPSGGCLPESCLETAIDYDSLIQAGAMMGSGGLVVMDDRTCMVDIARFFINFTRSESCGKCIPCREGIARLQEMLDTLVHAHEEETGDMALERFKAVVDLRTTCELIRDTAACGLGQTAPNPILSTLRYFKDEYEAHVFERRCPAGACTSLLKFTINPEACKGCGICRKRCPNEAIIGEIKHAHYIVAERCVRCGVCREVCPFHAVNVA